MMTMLRPIESQPTHAFVSPELEQAVNAVYADLQISGIDAACAAVGRMKNLQVFEINELPPGTTYIQYDPQNPDIVELPDFAKAIPDDHLELAQNIHEEVGTIFQYDNTHFSISALDASRHHFESTNPALLIQFLGERGYTLAANPKATNHIALPQPRAASSQQQHVLPSKAKHASQGVPASSKDQALPAPAASADSKEAVIEKDAPRFDWFAEVPTWMPREQLIAIRGALTMVRPAAKTGESYDMRRELSLRYGLTQNEINHAYKTALDDTLLNRIFSEGGNENHYGFAFDKITSKVVRTALQEVVRVAPSGAAYDKAIENPQDRDSNHTFDDILEASRAKLARELLKDMSMCLDVAPAQQVNTASVTAIMPATKTTLQLAPIPPAVKKTRIRPPLKQRVRGIIGNVRRKLGSLLNVFGGPGIAGAH